MASLTDDLVVEILSRLPIKSLCRSKCVSRHWRGLISHPDHRRKFPQADAGVFYLTKNSSRFPEETRRFTNFWEASRVPPLVRPSLSFLPGYERIAGIVDSCNGLLLCRRSESSSSRGPFRYVVCNPANSSWVELPDSGCGDKLRVARLAFDPAFYPLFHVFEMVEDEEQELAGAEIYCSETGAWRYKESECDPHIFIYDDLPSVFCDGFLHFLTDQFWIVSVNVEGDTWWMTPVPKEDLGDSGFLGQYKGHLCYMLPCDPHCGFLGQYKEDLSIWVLEDITTDDWILKHQVSIQKLIEKKISQSKSIYYHVITILPDCNFILYVADQDRTLMAYDIDHEEVHAIQNLGPDCLLPYIPYVPFYPETLTDGL